MGRIFISFANQDSATANRLCSVLEEKGRECWIAPRDIIPGQDYAGLITRAVREADAFILILSKSSYRSAHVLNELSLAFDQRLNIIPYSIDSSKMEDAFSYYLATKHRIESGGDFEKDMESIMMALSHGSAASPLPMIRKRSNWVWWLVAAVVLCAAAGIGIKAFSRPEKDQLLDNAPEMSIDTSDETTADPAPAQTEDRSTYPSEATPTDIKKAEEKSQVLIPEQKPDSSKEPAAPIAVQEETASEEPTPAQDDPTDIDISEKAPEPENATNSLTASLAKAKELNDIISICGDRMTMDELSLDTDDSVIKESFIFVVRYRMIVSAYGPTEADGMRVDLHSGARTRKMDYSPKDKVYCLRMK